jgi:archaetidylinositol phosphate synthase
METAATSKREMTFLLAAPERRLLQAIAGRIPRSIRSNHLTVLGVIGAIGTGLGYALSTRHPAWLWLASGMLVVNWLGDSLDGTLARVRHHERPKYGYYIDHIVDAFTIAVIGVGVGLSPFVRLDLALALVVVYLTLSINVYLESAVFGVFKIAYGRLGPTEVRLLVIVLNALLYLGALRFAWLEEGLSLAANLAVGVLVLGMFVMLAVRFGKNLYRLARMEPQKGLRRRPGRHRGA